MTSIRKSPRSRCGTWLLIGASLVASTFPASAAVTWHEVQFGGFASQGFLANTGHNDYLGNTSAGTFDFREYAASASFAQGQWRLGAQVFGQKLGQYGDDKIKLDWATVDYQVAQWLGFRAGRVKLPRGLYNEALDLDAVRPFVLLPQSVYDNRLRDFSAAFNGGMVYGNAGIAKLGSVDYRVYGGRMPLGVDSGASDYFNTDAPFPNKSIGIDSVVGGSVFWNLPVSGLRAGYSFSRFKDFVTVRYVPFRGRDSTKRAPHYDRHLMSLEYTWGDWVFATEYGHEYVHYEVTYPPAPPAVFLDTRDTYYYVSASRRINSWLELGTYYSHSNYRGTSRGTPVVIPTLKQGDFAVSARFDVNDHLILKLEGHYMDGAGKIFDLPSYPQPVAKRDTSWTMVAAKATVSF